MKKLFIMPIISALVVGLPLFAHAAEPKMSEAERLEHRESMVDHKIKDMDTNGDSTVSQAEYETAMNKSFIEADTNNDKMLSRSEIGDMVDKHMQKMRMMKEDKKMGK